MSESDKAEAERLAAELKTEAEKQKVVEVPPKQETSSAPQPEKKKGFLSRFGL